MSMLRYNNQGALSKPVDFYRPLTVDVSVEYELPKEVAPPPGSAPLLIIHPSAYFRSSSSKLSLSQPLSSSQKSSASQSSSSNASSSRLAELNSSLYYLRSSTNNERNATTNSSNSTTTSTTNASHNQNQLPTNHNNIQNGRSVRSSYGNVSSSSSSISRSRNVTMGNGESRASTSITSNCPYGKCDECSSGRSAGGTHNRLGSSIKKLSAHHHTNHHQHHAHANSTTTASVLAPLAVDPFYYSSSNISTSSSGGRANVSNSGSNNIQGSCNNSNSSFAVSTAAGMHAMDFGVSSSGTGPTITTSGKASNKRLRMMSQQQQTMHNPPTQPMEPLNLAVTPSASNSLLNPSSSSSSSLYQNTSTTTNNNSNNHFSISTLFNNNKSNSNNSNNHHGLMALNYGSTFPNNHRGSTPTAHSNLFAAQSTRYPKECPVPVDKSSGSDSGVCSENDSDVSPPMPMAPFSGQTRRSILSTDLSSAGCYCCCCPTTTSSTSRKSSKSKSSSSYGKSQSCNTSSGNSSGSLSNYSSSINVNSAALLGAMGMHDGSSGCQLDTTDSSMGNSPMDSSTYRKWFVGDSVSTSSLGRWFQV